MARPLFATLSFLGLLWMAASPALASELEGDLEPFLGAPMFEVQRVFDKERFPNLVVALDGTVLATFGSESIRLRRSEDGGQSWGPEIVVAEHGFHGGGVVVDEGSGDLLIFVEEGHPPGPFSVYDSTDVGRTWQRESATFHPDSRGNRPSMHMNEHGITLRRGEHAGRLIRPTRYYGESNESDHWASHYTNSIYSDDHGRTWFTSEPFPELGTGEAAIVELSDGRLYYNSRQHLDADQHRTRRRSAVSLDSGLTWQDWKVDQVLPDGRQDRTYGLMAGLVRLPVAGRDVLVFSNIDTERPLRERISVWVSFDGGQTWPMKRLVFDGPSAYSSLDAGRPGTPSEGWIYLQFEGGPQEAAGGEAEHPGSGSAVARFNLSWLLGGEATGDGSIPAWAQGDLP